MAVLCVALEKSSSEESQLAGRLFGRTINEIGVQRASDGVHRVTRTCVYIIPKMLHYCCHFFTFIVALLGR